MSTRYFSDDAGPAAVAAWNATGVRISNEQRRASELLRRLGARAEHPDDGWVDRARYGIYDGTSGIAAPVLYETADDAWAAYRHGDCWSTALPVDVEPVDVDVATDYGRGFSWRGRATRSALHEGTAPFGVENQDGTWCVSPAEGYMDGEPEWIKS